MEKLPKARNKMDVPKTEEKELTDEIIVKVLECKLTDEIIVKALEHKKEYLLEEEKRTGKASDSQIVNIWGEGVFKILDLIKRLQAENEQLKCDTYKTSWKAKFFEAKKEIERMAEKNNEIFQRYLNVIDKNNDLQNQVDKVEAEKEDLCHRNERLQKQVDELKDERENMQAEILRFEDMKFTQEHCDLYSENEALKQWLKRLNADLEYEKNWGKQQIVKDTVKECYEIFKFYRKNYYDIPMDFVARELKEKTGVEVE